MVEGAPRGQNDEEARIFLLRLLLPHSLSRSEYVLNYFTVNLYKQTAGLVEKENNDSSIRLIFLLISFLFTSF